MPFGPDKSSCRKFGHNHSFPSCAFRLEWTAAFRDTIRHYFVWKYAAARGHLSTNWGSINSLPNLLVLKIIRWRGGPWKNKSPPQHAMLSSCCFCIGDFWAPLIRLGEGSLLPKKGKGGQEGQRPCQRGAETMPERGVERGGQMPRNLWQQWWWAPQLWK